MIATEYLAASCDHWFLYKLNTDFPCQSFDLMRACVVSFYFTQNHSISSAHSTQFRHLNETNIYSHRMDSFMKTNKQQIHKKRHHYYSRCLFVKYCPVYRHSFHSHTYLRPANTHTHTRMYIEQSVIYVTTVQSEHIIFGQGLRHLIGWRISMWVLNKHIAYVFILTYI